MFHVQHQQNSIGDLTPQRVTAPKKVILVDADNVLWSGAASERRPEQLYKYAIHEAFQRELYRLKERGALLVLMSKNDEGELQAALKRGPDQLLSASDFHAIYANFLPKSENAKDIARKLRFAYDAFVFVDDNPAELAAMQAVLPEVECLLFPLDHEGGYSQLIAIDARGNSKNVWLKDLDALAGANIKLVDVKGRPVIIVDEFFALLQRLDQMFPQRTKSVEAARRSELYREEDKREEFRRNVPSYEEYLSRLDMRGVIREGRGNLENLARLAELTERTTQFNMTGRRYRPEELLHRLESSRERFTTFSFQLEDRFGNAGTVAVITLQASDGNTTSWEVENFCLSCRALGRGVEQTLFDHVATRMPAYGCSTLRGSYVATSRNGNVALLYQELGFENCGTNQWVLALDLRKPTHRSFIDVRSSLETPLGDKIELLRPIFSGGLGRDELQAALFARLAAKELGAERVAAEVNRFAQIADSEALRKLLHLEVLFAGERRVVRDIIGDHTVCAATCGSYAELQRRLITAGHEILHIERLHTEYDYEDTAPDGGANCIVHYNFYYAKPGHAAVLYDAESFCSSAGGGFFSGEPLKWVERAYQACFEYVVPNQQELVEQFRHESDERWRRRLDELPRREKF